MSDTTVNSMDRVRLLIHDTNPQDYAIDSEQMLVIFNDQVQMVAAQTYPPGQVWGTTVGTGAISLVAGDYDYTLFSSGSLTYQQVLILQLNSQGWILERVPPEVLQAMRGPTPASGDPTHYALFEQTGQTIMVWLYPTPAKTDIINVMRTNQPTIFTDAANTVDFGNNLIRALEKLVAARCVESLDAAALEKLRINPAVTGGWRAEAQRQLRDERVRIARLRRRDALPKRYLGVA